MPIQVHATLKEGHSLKVRGHGEVFDIVAGEIKGGYGSRETTFTVRTIDSVTKHHVAESGGLVEVVEGIVSLEAIRGSTGHGNAIQVICYAPPGYHVKRQSSYTNSFTE